MSTQQTFERSLTELESIVEKLEVGDMQLEESLELFERGVTLIRDCRGRLTGAERRIEELTKSMNGDLEAVDIDVESIR
ncbi:MAG TPA: exodeoxyribonuclease VII small subunit [Pyrinomonadaceae bacterium]|nr:exodeoxyribonuclease VII small subunit [Pyrinomonadaceae bacterium]